MINSEVILLKLKPRELNYTSNKLQRKICVIELTKKIKNKKKDKKGKDMSGNRTVKMGQAKRAGPAQPVK